MGDWGYFLILLISIGITAFGVYGATRDYYYKQGRLDGIKAEKKRHIDAKI